MTPRPAASLVVFLLLLSALLAFIPVRPAFGSGGNPTLGVTDTDSVQPSTFTAGAAYVNVTAGSDAAKTDGSVTGFFAIDFGTFGGSQLVTFSGAQFTLYFSKDGFAQISPTDVSYSGPNAFSVSDLTTNAGWHTVTEASGPFYIGQTTGGQEVVVGPLPINASDAYQYIKIFDGSTTAVAVSVLVVNLQPAMKLSSTSGPAGLAVTATGGGFPASKTIELVYSYTLNPWSGAPSVRTGNWTTNLSTAGGTFSFRASMVDTKQVYNPNSGVVPATTITISAKYQASPHALLASATFDEKSRVVTGVLSLASDGSGLDLRNAPPGPYGNDTSSAGSNLAQAVNVNVLGSLNVAGDHWSAGATVTLSVGSTQVGSATANGTGYFNATVTVPILPGGTYVFKVSNSGIAYQFNIVVLPTLTLTPSSGPVGAAVSVQAYGFPADSLWFVYWHEKALGDNKWYQLAHGTVGASGTFNETVTFTVPTAYGGGHSVSAASANVTTVSPGPPAGTVVIASFAVGTSTTTTTTATVTTTVIQSTTLTESVTVTQTTTQTGTTRSTTQTQTVTQTATSTVVQSADFTYSYVALGAAGIAIASLAALLLRGRMSK